jgi:nucleotide-binding universal stress UspA family protein
MYKRILVPVDGSPTSVRGLDEAIALAKLGGGRLHLVHVLDRVVLSAGETYTVDVFGMLREAGERILEQAKARAAAAGLEASAFISEPMPGRVCDVVAAQAQACGADLIVVGTHGRRGMSRLLVGSDAEQIVRVAPIPVLLVRGVPDRSPVVAAAAAVAAA